MTLLEYVDSLFQQNVPEEEIVAKTQEWKKKNNYGVSEQPSVLKEDLKPKEEVKIDDVAGKKDATVTSTSDASKAIEKIAGQSKFGTGPSSLPDPKQSFDLVGRTAKQVSGVTPIFQGVDLNPGEVKKANKHEYKYEIGEDKQPVFYTKKEGQQDWSNVTANKAKNPGAELGVAEELGFDVGDFDREKELKRKEIKKDFDLGNYLEVGKNKDEVIVFDATNIKGLTKDGEMLTTKELFFKNKAKPSRYADSFVDENFEEKELEKQNKKPLDSKIKDYIVNKELNLNNKYEQFKNQEYSGKYVQDLGPDIYKKTFEDFNPDKINNFTSSDEFLGFLQEKGYMQDYIDTVYGPGLTLAEGDDIQKFKIGKQRKLDRYFKLYIQEANSKYTDQVLVSHILKNKEKFKNIKSLSEAYNLAKDYFLKKYGQSNFESISYNDYKSYREEEFPELVSAEKKLQAARKAKSEELIKEGSSEGLLQDSFTKFYDGVISRAKEQAYELRNMLGFDMGYATMLDAEENLEKSVEDVRYGYIEGKKAEVDGVEYIKDSNGSIYNVTNKVSFIPSNAKEFEKVDKAIEESEETGSSFSAAGSTEQFFATSGTMLFDIASIYGLGKFTKATKLGTLTNAVKIPKASFDTMSYYTFAGYVSTKKNIFNELVANGVNETKAKEVAEEGGRIGGLWTGATSLLAPVPTYLKRFDKILGNRSIIQSAIKGYKKNGPTGFFNNFKETLKNIKITKQGAIRTGIAGIKEFSQEQVQQYGEITGVNSYVNKLLGKDVLTETYSRQDFVNTGIVSFASGSAFANLNIPGFKPSAAQQLNNLYVLGKDTTQTQKLLNEMVAEGKATQEEAGKVMSGIRSVKNQMSRIPASISAETKLESARLQQDIADLQEKKSRTDEVYHSSIDSQIDAKKKELAEVVKPELEKAAARKGAKKAAEQLNAGFENFSTQQDMDSAAEGLTEDGWEVQDSTGYGMALTKGKQKIILINDQAAAEDNRYTTDQHEVLHPFWEAALKANPKAAIDLGKALMVEIINNKDINAGTELLSRFSGYLSDENYSAENTWEEVIPLVSEALSNGDITYNKKQEAWWKNLGTKISDFLKGNKKPLSLEFNTGKDVFYFIEGYNKSIEAGKGLTKQQLEVAEKGAKGKLIEEGFDKESTYTVKEGETIQDVADKFDTTVQNLKDLNKTSGTDLKAGDNLIVDVGVKIVERASDIKAAQQVEKAVAKESKRVYQKVESMKEDLVNPETKMTTAFMIANDPSMINEIDRRLKFEADEATREDVIRNFLFDDKRGLVGLLRGYDPSKNESIMGYLNSSTPGGKLLDIRLFEFFKDDPRYERIIQSETQEGVTEKMQRQTAETQETTSETKEKPIAKKPTETVKYSDAIIEKAGVKDKAELEAKITEATKESFKDVDVERFGQTKDVPPAVAEIYGNMLGLNPETISDKTRTYQNYDEAGLNAAQRFLLANATNDFARLPKTKDETTTTGRGTFIPKNMKDALYTDGRLTGTLKDYMGLIRSKPTGKLYRDSKYAQLIRGLLNTHIRNRMFEDLVTTTPERLRGGAKFSKRIEQALGKEAALEEEVKGIKANIQKIITNAMPSDLSAFDLSTLESRQEAVRFMENEFFPKLFEVFGVDARVLLKSKELAPSGNNIISYKPGKRVQKIGGALGRDQLGITDVNRASKEIELNKELADAGLVYQVKNILKEFNSLDLKGKKSEAIETALKNQATKDAESNLKTRELHKKGYKDFLNLFKKLYDSDPIMMKGIGFLMYNPGANFAFYRNLAQIIGSQEGVKKGREEHVYQAGNWAKRTLEAMSSKNPKVWENWLEWSAENYYQEAIEGKDKGKESSEYVVDAIYKKDRYLKPSDRPYWMPKTSDITYESQSMEHPLLKSALDKAMKTGDFSKVPDPKIRYYNDYLSLNPNLLGNKGVTDAKKYNVEVPNDFILNPEAYKYQGELIYGQILTEAGILTGSDAITKSKARQLLDNYLKTAKLKAEAAIINNNLQPNNIKLEGENAKSSKRVVNELETLDNALNQARRPDAPVKKIRVFDFDDTLARSKSQVIVNERVSSEPQVIFLTGAAGSGKTTVAKNFGKDFVVVDKDVELQALMKEAGLPSDMNKLTRKQGEQWRDLQSQASNNALNKINELSKKGKNIIIDDTGSSEATVWMLKTKLGKQGYETKMVLLDVPLEQSIKRNRNRKERILTDTTVKNSFEALNRNKKRFKELFKNDFTNVEGGKVSSDLINKVISKTYKITPGDFAEKASTLEAQGATFDFTEFSKVVDGKKGPLFSVAQKIAEARGTEDIFILTARPADAAGPIQEFMKANGIDIPLANITGLGDGTAAAKGRWIAGKAAEGYNDFYFADDAIKNVKAVKDVLSQIDVKSKVQQAKASKRIVFDKVFNDIIEAKTGIESYKDFSAAKAKTVGSSKGKFTFFTTPSAEDFVGLLYKTLGKGKVGDAQMAFYKTNLIDPYNRAEMAISQAKVAAGRDYKALKKQFKNIPKTLEKETGIAKYTYQHAIRTYIWNGQGLEVPGLSKRDQKRLTDFIKADPELQAFADQLVNIQKGKPYPKPDKDWTAGNITTDVISGINKVNRAEYLQEWQENVDIIFSEKNMNKLEAAFGAKYVEALKDSLRAMKSGSNRPLGGDRVSNGILDWLNNSVGAIMFLNTRSAVLQTISAVNFINWGDNNILKAGKAFANQKQFWSDFLTLMNSDYLLERRDGLKINVSESEIADAVEGSKNKVNAAISYLLNKGFVFTRYADSFAIASGGATFYRNRIESLVEQGMDRKAAEQQAFEDFRLIAEENQQSSSPMRISQQQRSLIGRIILQFGNTQLQYVRIQKRAVQDLVNGRGDWKSNISKIVYYGAIQNLLFNALQSGLAWALFDDDEDDEELTEKNKEQKLERTINGAIDSQLKGLGIQGAVIAGVKNALMTIAKEADKRSPKFEEALDDLLSIAPALGSKIRKLKSAARTVSWNRKEIKEKGFSMDNPAYLAGAQVISAAFNIPLDRAVMKMNNMRNILNPATENWQKVALALGWSGWDVGLPYFGLAEDKPVLTETEKQTKKLFDLNKSDQVKMLLDLGLTKKQIRALTKEEQRVQEIIKLQNKKKDGKDKS